MSTQATAAAPVLPALPPDLATPRPKQAQGHRWTRDEAIAMAAKGRAALKRKLAQGDAVQALASLAAGATAAAPSRPALPTPLSAQSSPPQLLADVPRDDWTRKRLAGVRRHIDRLDRLMCKTEKPQDLQRLAEAMRKLGDLEASLSGRALRPRTKSPAQVVDVAPVRAARPAMVAPIGAAPAGLTSEQVIAKPSNDAAGSDPGAVNNG